MLRSSYAHFRANDPDYDWLRGCSEEEPDVDCMDEENPEFDEDMEDWIND